MHSQSFSTCALQWKKHSAKTKWHFWPEWPAAEWPEKVSEENILRQGKVPIQLNEMQKTCFSSKWSVTQKTIILFNL